jgi:predicted transcriptional regulator
MRTAIAKLDIPHWLSLAGEDFIYLAHKLPEAVTQLLPHLATPKSADDLAVNLNISRKDLVSRLQQLWRLGLLLRRRIERCNESNEFYYCYQLPARAQFKVWEVTACVAN